MEDIFLELLNRSITAGWLIFAVAAARMLDSYDEKRMEKGKRLRKRLRDTEG